MVPVFSFGNGSKTNGIMKYIKWSRKNEGKRIEAIPSRQYWKKKAIIAMSFQSM